MVLANGRETGMKTIRTAIVGTGFMGRVHLEAVRRVEFVEAAAIAGRNEEAARRLGSLVFRCGNHRLSRCPSRSCDRRSPHLYAQRAALFHGERGAASREACDLREAADNNCGRGRGTRLAGREPGTAQLRLPQLALLPDGSADAPPARSGRSGRDSRGAGNLFPGLAALRYGLELACGREGWRCLALYGGYRIALV